MRFQGIDRQASVAYYFERLLLKSVGFERQGCGFESRPARNAWRREIWLADA